MLAAAARPGIAILGGYNSTVLAMAFSPDGKTLASGSADNTVQLRERGHPPTDRRPPHRTRRLGLLGSVQPGRQNSGQRQLRSIRAVVERRQTQPAAPVLAG